LDGEHWKLRGATRKTLEKERYAKQQIQQQLDSFVSLLRSMDTDVQRRCQEIALLLDADEQDGREFSRDLEDYFAELAAGDVLANIQASKGTDTPAVEEECVERADMPVGSAHSDAFRAPGC
jgi:hypothetical protein